MEDRQEIVGFGAISLLRYWPLKSWDVLQIAMGYLA